MICYDNISVHFIALGRIKRIMHHLKNISRCLFFFLDIFQVWIFFFFRNKMFNIINEIVYGVDVNRVPNLKKVFTWRKMDKKNVVNLGLNKILGIFRDCFEFVPFGKGSMWIMMWFGFFAIFLSKRLKV